MFGNAPVRSIVLLAAVVLLGHGCAPSPAHSQPAPPAPSAGNETQLEKLVAPIALYPDPLVAQILPASTYPVQVIEAARTLANGARPSQATASQWDPSVQALLSFPTVLKMMNDKIQWTTQLGQAVASNQSAVMAAIQHVRQQAHQAGNLESNQQQIVSVQGSGTSSTIIIQPASPQVIYVPQYNPLAIYAPAPYYGYPFMTFGLGFAAGAATAYWCNWGSYGGYGSVTVNNNYHYNVNNSYGAYHPNSGVYTGYNSKTGTYGAYNPATGKYGTYNPSTGAYNKNGQTGTWHPPSSSDVGRSMGDYNANQYKASGAGGGYGSTASGARYGSDPAAGARYGGDTASGARYGGDQAAGTGGSARDTGTLGGGYGQRASSGGGWDSGSRGYGGGWDSAGRGSGGWDSAGRDGGWGGDRGWGGDTFRGLGGGGWGSQMASDRGWRSSGGFGGGGFGGFRGGFRR